VVVDPAGEATILVGSCPKTKEDVRRLHAETGVQAILSLQVRRRNCPRDCPHSSPA
jgi:hypothetical protein